MHLFRTRLKKDIIAEFLPAEKSQKSKDFVILCDGMPSMPAKRRLIDFLSKKGFVVIHPRYRGTWESAGNFLDHSPHEDILDVVDALQEDFQSIMEEVPITVYGKPDKIFVIGSSFGGTAAILSTLDSRVTKAVALSPVVDWKKMEDSDEEPMDILEKEVREGFGEAYRFEHKNWERLSQGEFYNPVEYTDKLDPAKFMIIHAQDDTIVPVSPVEKFAKDVGCEFLFLKKGGHLSASKIMKWQMWRRVKKFFGI